MQYLHLLSLIVCFTHSHAKPTKPLTYTMAPKALTTFELSYIPKERVFYLCNPERPELRAATRLEGREYTATSGKTVRGVYILQADQRNTGNVQFTEVAKATNAWQHALQILGHSAASVIRKPSKPMWGIQPEEIIRWAMRQWIRKLKLPPYQMLHIGDSMWELDKDREHLLCLMKTKSLSMEAYKTSSEYAEVIYQLQLAKKILQMDPLEYDLTYRGKDFEFLEELNVFISNSEAAWIELAKEDYRLGRFGNISEAPKN